MTNTHRRFREERGHATASARAGQIATKKATKAKAAKRLRLLREPVVPAFELDAEAEAVAEEFIAEATSAEHVAEEARDEALDEETELYGFDQAAIEVLIALGEV